MPVSKKLRAEFIDLGILLAPTYDQASMVTRDFTINLNAVDLDKCAPAERWKRLFDFLDNNNAVSELIEGIKRIYPGNQKILELEKHLQSENPETVINELKQIIASRRCVLFLGPEILKVELEDEKVPFNRILSTEFSKELDRRKIYYDVDQKMNLSYLIDRYERSEKIPIGKTENFAKEIYNQCEIDDRIFKLIEQLKFPLIVNTNPDTKLVDLFGRSRFSSTYYDFSSNITPEIGQILGKSDVTHVYNIYGSFEDPYSIVFTEKESVEFARKAYERNPLIPKVINETIHKCYGLFIGFNFNDWHLKILFDVLELRDKPQNYSITGIANNCPEHMREYFERQYDMKFIKNDIVTILRSIV